MSRRIVLQASGLLVSDPGYDALTAADANLSFSTSRIHGMVVQAGTAHMVGNSVYVPFTRQQPNPPLVFAWVPGTDMPANTSPIKCIATVDGFTAYAQTDANGTIGAANQDFVYQAFARQQ